MIFKDFFSAKPIEVSLREDEEGNLYFTDKKNRYDLRKLPKNKIFHARVLKLEGVDFSKLGDLSNVFADQMFLNGTASTLVRLPKAEILYLMGIHNLEPLLLHLPKETKALDIFDCSIEGKLNFPKENEVNFLSWNRGYLPDGFAYFLPTGLKELVIRDVPSLNLAGLSSKTKLTSLVLSEIEDLKGNIGANLPISLLELSIGNCNKFKDLDGISKQSNLEKLKIILCPNLSENLASSFPASLKELEIMQSSFKNFKGIHSDVLLDRFVFNLYYSENKPDNLLDGLNHQQLSRLNFDWVPPTYRPNLRMLRCRAYHRLNQRERKKISFTHPIVRYLVRNVRHFLTR